MSHYDDGREREQTWAARWMSAGGRVGRKAAIGKTKSEQTWGIILCCHRRGNPRFVFSSARKSEKKWGAYY
jgi:hypothetical protein